MDYLACSVVIGSGATALMDVWGVARKRLLGNTSLDYALVGRWLAHLARGLFRHDRITAAPPVHGERAIGWIAHYVIGIGFAAVLLAIWGLDWVRQPMIGPALTVGIASVLAPFLVMQPSMGAGIAASRTARPGNARLHSLATHAVFGLGLYMTAVAARPVTSAILGSP